MSEKAVPSSSKKSEIITLDKYSGEEKHLRNLLKKTVSPEYQSALANLLFQKAKLLNDIKLSDEALDACSEAEFLLRELVKIPEKKVNLEVLALFGSTLELKSIILSNIMEDLESLYYAEQAVQIFRKILSKKKDEESLHGLVRNLLNLGDIYIKFRNLVLAIEIFNEAIERIIELIKMNKKYSDLAVRAIKNRGICYKYAAEPKKALADYLNAEYILEHLIKRERREDLKPSWIELLSLIAQVYSELHFLDEALKVIEYAESMYENLPDDMKAKVKNETLLFLKNIKARIFNYKAKLLEQMSQFEKREDLPDEAQSYYTMEGTLLQEILSRSKSIHEWLHATVNYYEYLTRIQDFENAKKLISESIERIPEFLSGHIESLTNTLGMLVDLVCLAHNVIEHNDYCLSVAEWFKKLGFEFLSERYLGLSKHINTFISLKDKAELLKDVKYFVELDSFERKHFAPFTTTSGIRKLKSLPYALISVLGSPTGHCKKIILLLYSPDDGFTRVEMSAAEILTSIQNVPLHIKNMQTGFDIYKLILQLPRAIKEIRELGLDLDQIEKFLPTVMHHRMMLLPLQRTEKVSDLSIIRDTIGAIKGLVEHYNFTSLDQLETFVSNIVKKIRFTYYYDDAEVLEFIDILRYIVFENAFRAIRSALSFLIKYHPEVIEFIENIQSSQLPLVISPYSFFYFFPLEMLPKSSKPIICTNKIARTFSIQYQYNEPVSLKKIYVLHDPGIKSFLPLSFPEVKAIETFAKSINLGVKKVPWRRKDILEALKNASIFHYTGHGAFRFHPQEGVYYSHLAISNGIRIDYRDALITSGGNKGLAVLSSCRSGFMRPVATTIDFFGILPSLITSGFRGVLAPMWPISDNLAYNFFRTFYHYLSDSLDVPESILKTRRELFKSARILKDDLHFYFPKKLHDVAKFENIARVYLIWMIQYYGDINLRFER